ncbi:MAG: hypothetical protein RL106_201 [Bacteroidota bacterium]|jgi:two-component system phosphate regulon sensor histidine kinase PhoR
MKPRTPNGVAVWTAAWIVMALSIIIGVLVGFRVIKIQALLPIAIGLSILAVFSYYLIGFFIEKFLYAKIKVIYKNIHAFKSQSDKRAPLLMADDVLHDIEDQVSEWVEEKINEVKTLRDADSFRKEFIGNLAHELKTPLFGIQGYIETLLDDDLNDPEQIRLFLSKANRQADRLNALIGDLDQISKLESGGIPIVMARFDLVQCVQAAMETVEKLALSKNVHLYVKEGSPKQLMVKGDYARVQQVLINLISNAIHYGNVNGEVKVRFYDMEEHVLCEVADNGIGIAKEHLPRIFERFYRVDKSRSRNDGGSGLGLAICKHIIEAHQETISVRSTEGIGSTFAFTLKKA